MSPADGARAKILPLAGLVERREALRREGKTVVQCHGCFDIVHPGHIRYLRFARQQGDVLIVSVSSDAVVGKGVDRPYIHEELRLENLAALEMVDYVCLDEHSWAGPVLEALTPDVYVKGREYETKRDPRFLREKELVESYGGRVIYSSGEVVYSSTAILSRFREGFRLEQEKIGFFCRRNDIDRAAVDHALRAFADRSLLVVGDPVLDRYVHCDALGVAAESPMPSLTPIGEDWYLGAGALIALQAAALGARVGFVTPLGEGAEAARLVGGLQEAGIEVVPIEATGRGVYVKTRYLVEDKKLFKVNEGHYAPLSTAAARALGDEIERRLPDYDGLLVTDFGFGLFGGETAERIAAVAEASDRPYFADVSHTGRSNIRKFRRPYLAAPTEEELRFAFADNESGISNLASRYYRECEARNLVITMGKRGVVFFDPPAVEAGRVLGGRRRGDRPVNVRLTSDYLPALASRPVDTVGAGDVFLTTLALACLADLSVAQGVYLGSATAAVHVDSPGNEPVLLADLDDFLASRPELAGER